MNHHILFTGNNITLFFSSSRTGSVCDRWMQRGARSFFCAEYGAGSVFALRGCAVTRCSAKSRWKNAFRRNEADVVSMCVFSRGGNAFADWNFLRIRYIGKKKRSMDPVFDPVFFCCMAERYRLSPHAIF